MRVAASTLCAIWIGFAATVSATAQETAEDSSEPNNGNDITKPIHRLDVFLNNTRSIGGVQSWTSTLRYERPFALEDAWKIAFRVEFPFVVTNESGSSAPPAAFTSGYGDTLFQAVLSKELNARQGFGFGLRFIAPTATGDQFGNGRWRMLPSPGVVCAVRL